MIEDTVLDTTIHEPPMSAGEVEDARHVGHADLLREAVDGRWEDPPQP
jgi:Protein of unknown function (DUF664)